MERFTLSVWHRERENAFSGLHRLYQKRPLLITSVAKCPRPRLQQCSGAGGLKWTPTRRHQQSERMRSFQSNEESRIRCDDRCELTVYLANDYTAVVITATQRGRVDQITDLRSGRDILVILNKKSGPRTDYVSSWAGGWDSLFPNLPSRARRTMRLVLVRMTSSDNASMHLWPQYHGPNRVVDRSTSDGRPLLGYLYDQPT